MIDLDEGVIKYDSAEFTKTPELKPHEYLELERCRKILWKNKLIGVYEAINLGFGNISIRTNLQTLFKSKMPQFIITGTQTGHLPDLDGNSYTRVVDFNITQNTVATNGPLKASSEALTHGLIYLSNQEITTVFHLHHPAIWKNLIKTNFSSTAENIKFGTQELAIEAAKISKNSPNGAFVLKGHEDGIIIFANSTARALDMALEMVNAFSY